MTAPRRLDFVGVGAARCGTTWAAKCLDQHPEIFVPEKKELHFFNHDRKWSRFGPAWLDQYFDYDFPGRVGEFTPRYLINPEALRRIKEAFPDTKILVILRDPLLRALSQFHYFRLNRHKEPEPCFEKALLGPAREDYLDKSLYAGQMEGLLKIFDRDQVFVGIYEELTTDPAGQYAELFRFLGVNDDFFPPAAKRRVNASGSSQAAPRASLARLNRFVRSSSWPLIRHRRIKKWVESLIRSDIQNRPAEPEVDLSEEAKARLWTKFFQDDIGRLSGVLGRDFSGVWGRFE